MANCNTCFEDYVCKCIPYNDVLTINTFVPAGTYTFLITDKFGNKYTGDATRNADGTLEIAIAHLPDGLINPFSGQFTIQIFDNETCNSPVPLPLVRNYDCITIEAVGGNSDKSNIGCENPFVS